MLFMILICIYSASLPFHPVKGLEIFNPLGHHSHTHIFLLLVVVYFLIFLQSHISASGGNDWTLASTSMNTAIVFPAIAVVVAPAEVADASTAAAAARGSISSEALALIFNLSALCNLSEQKTVLELGLVCSNAGTVEFALTDYFGSQKARIGSSDGQFYWTCNLTN